MKLVVGSEDSEFVRAVFGERPYHGASDSFSRNMVAVRVDLRVHPFSGSFEATWQSEWFPRIRDDLQRLYETLEGIAEFQPDYEGSLVLRFSGDGVGHIAVSGDAHPDPLGLPCLRFELPGIDQTYLPALIDSFDELITAYPTL